MSIGGARACLRREVRGLMVSGVTPKGGFYSGCHNSFFFISVRRCEVQTEPAQKAHNDISCFAGGAPSSITTFGENAYFTSEVNRINRQARAQADSRMPFLVAFTAWNRVLLKVVPSTQGRM